MAFILSLLLTIFTPQATAQQTGGNIGDPCDPETYEGPYECVPDERSVSGYAIAN